MASLELGKLSSYDLLLSEDTQDIYYVKLTDSLYKTLEDYHSLNSKGDSRQLQLSVNKTGRGGVIEVCNESSTRRYNFKCTALSNKTGLDCLKQTQANPGLTLVGTAATRLIIQATEDVYQKTREKLIMTEEKKNESQTVMIDNFKNKRKSIQSAKVAKLADNPATSFSKSSPQVIPSASKAPQRTVPTFKASSSISSDSKAQRQLRERAIHILALRPHRKIELLSKLQEQGSKSKDAVTKILAQISNTQNNMFHLKSFLYGEVQVDTWPDYSEWDRSSVRQQLKLHGIEKSPEQQQQQQQQQQQPSTNRSESPAEEQAPKPQEQNKKVEQYLQSAPKFVKQGTQPEPSKPPVQDQRTSSLRNDSSRKRSSSDDAKSSKKPCRDSETTAAVGVNINSKSRKAAEELHVPFMERVKSSLAKIQLDYVTIVSREQQMSYAADFHTEYEEYLKLKKKEKEVGQQFAALKASYDKAEKKSPEFRSITRKTRDLFKQYINDSNWCKDKERLMKLEAKLAHIKALFKQYDESAG